MAQIDADWLRSSATQSVFDMLAGFPTYAVGGCVRNTLLDEPVKDIDIATAARPKTVIARAGERGFRAVPTGIEHGTVTVIVENTPYEITTFRQDVETDGRRAVVAYADCVEDDGLRRDFTINAIYADASGRLLDPVGGLPDIAARRIRFIENADRRIKEDYLRSLRFFRFHAWYGSVEGGIDEDAIHAIARNRDGIETVSRERIGSELLRLLEAPDPAPAIAAMRNTGVLSLVLAGADDTAISPLVSIEGAADVSPSSLRRLSVLGGDFGSLRLSRKEMLHLTQIRDNIGLPPHEAGYLFGWEIGRDIALVTYAVSSAAVPGHALVDVKRGATSEFPISAADLLDEFQGPELGQKLKSLEKRWVDSNFTLSKSELLSQG